MRRPEVGVLALQGGVAEHVEMLGHLGASTRLVRRAEHLTGLDALVLPGGESSTIDRLTRLFDLRDPLIAAIRGGLPTLGTCAGLIMLSCEIDDPAPGQQSLGIMDIGVARNAFGSQVDSAEATLAWKGTAVDVVRAAFIRAPIVTRLGDNVEPLAEHEGKVVAVRQDHVLGISFHPELTGDPSVHQELLASLR